ncbi:MAG: DNA polymerase III subunit gamma/tau [Clostridia bacterium]|nr:DNA polymerase III subunit gamma/tau [Clostridia bacterium]
MAYQALYRKWRPSVFEDVVGQDHIVDTLKNQINTNKIAHAYLFCGSRGTGKTSTAKIFSRAVNCEHPVNGNPCNECDTCLGIINNSIFDVIEIDGASNNKVDDIRNIRDEVVYPPANCKYKVYIIDEVHMLTTEAFNALLKTLEEPPQYVIFILATTEFHKIPATIISRCQKFDFKRITYNDTAKRIRKVAMADNIDVTESAVKLIAKAADGSLRDGLSKLDQCLALGLTKIDYKDVANIIGASDPEFLSKFCDAIIDEKIGDSYKLLDDGVNMGIDPLRLFTDVIDYFRDLMMIKTSNDYSLIINNEEEVIKKYNEQCSKLTISRLLKIIENLFEAQNNSKYLASPKLAFETALLKIASKNTSTDIETLLDRLEKLEEKIKDLSQGNIPCKNLSVEFNKNTAPQVFPLEYNEETKKEETDDLKESSITQIAQDIIKEDEEYDFSSEYSEEDDYEGYTIPNEVNIDNFTINDMPENAILNDNTENKVIDTKIEEKVDSKEILSYIKLNFKDFLVNIKNKDIGFDNIMLSTVISLDDTGIVFDFDNKTKLDIALGSKYDKLIKEAINDVYGIEVSVKLKGQDNVTEDEEIASDPLDDLFKLAEQNQVIFNFED